MSAGIEGTADLYTSERTVGKISAVFPGKGNALGNALVDYGSTYLGKTVDIGLTAAVIASLDGIVEKPVNRVIVILIVLGSVYTSLSRN